MAARRYANADAQHEIELAAVARALAREAVLRRLSTLLHDADIPILHLPHRGGGVGKVDEPVEIELLVAPEDAPAAELILERDGWDRLAVPGSQRFEPISTYAKNSSIVRMLRSIRITRPLPRRLSRLERDLWQGAAPGPSGILEPREEPLFVLRAARTLGRRHGIWNDDSGERVPVPAEEIDRAEVRRLAERSHVRAALEAPADRFHPAALIPAALRDRLREARAMHQAGYGFVAERRRSTRVLVGTIEVDVAPGVFEPRLPITNTLLTTAVSASEHLTWPRVVEVGTGSGAVALAYATARSDARVVAMDVSYRAVACARGNRDRLGLSSVRITQSNLLARLPHRAIGNVDIIVANVPYIPPSTAPATDWGAPVETVQGLDQDGLGLMLRLARQATRFLRPGGSIVLQLTGWQWETLGAELSEIGYSIAEPQTWGDDRAAISCAVWPGGAARPTGPGGKS